MSDIIGPPKVGLHPVIVKILEVFNVGGPRMTEDALNQEIATFFDKWGGTHVLSAPSYLIGSDGSERLYLQAVDRTLWLLQNEQQGIAQARTAIAGQEEAQRLQSGKVALASLGEIPQQPAPRPPRRIEGGFR